MSFDTRPADNQIEDTTEDDPQISNLLTELQQMVDDMGDWVQKVQDGEDIRFCLWDGQSIDGKKRGENLDKEPFPWEGASDSRVRLADSVINEQVMIMKRAFFSAKVSAIPTKVAAGEESRLVQGWVQWTLWTHLRADLIREVELACNWRQEFGACVMGIFWKQDTTIELQEVKLRALQDMAAEDPQWQPFVVMLLDPLQKDDAAGIVQQMHPVLSITQARQAVKDLRETGTATLEVPTVLDSRPEWQALQPYYDVVFSRGVSDLQRSRLFSRRLALTVSEIKGRIVTEDWDEDWVDQAIKHKGERRKVSSCNTVRNWKGDQISLDRDLIEVWETYYWGVDENNINRLWCTVLHDSIPKTAAWHGLAKYKHKQYPGVLLVRERARRSALDSRGVPELVGTQQNEIKTQRDYRSDRASISILPPLRVPSNRGKLQVLMGPGVQIPERRAGEFGWFQPPPFDQGTVEIEKSTRGDVDEYFGVATNWSPNMPVSRQQLHYQDLVDTVLMEFGECVVMTFMLMQQYVPVEEVIKIMGLPPESAGATEEEIRGRYNIMLAYDVRDLDMEWIGKKLDLVKGILALDTGGLVDRAPLVRVAMSWLDPELSRQTVGDAQKVSQNEVRDEQQNFALIAAGTEPQPVDSGQNFQLRLQTLQQIFNSNPAIQKRYGEDEIFQKMFQDRVKHLQFQIGQQSNAQIGRFGVKPGIGAIGM